MTSRDRSTPGKETVKGTCRTNLFTPLLTVHHITPNSDRLPFAYGLLSGKRQEMYSNLLNELDTNGPFQPETVLAEFEMGPRNAIFNAASRGCYFHFKQCLWRNFNRLCLTSEYQVEDVENAWIELKFTIRHGRLLFPVYLDWYHWTERTFPSILLKSP